MCNCGKSRPIKQPTSTKTVVKTSNGSKVVRIKSK